MLSLFFVRQIVNILFLGSSLKTLYVKCSLYLGKILSVTHFKPSSGIYRLPFFVLRHFSKSFKKGAMISVYSLFFSLISLYSLLSFRCITSNSAMDLVATYCSVCNLTFCFLAILIVHTVRAMPIGKLISKYTITNIINAVSKSLSLRNNKHGSITMNITHTAKSIKKVR